MGRGSSKAGNSSKGGTIRARAKIPEQTKEAFQDDSYFTDENLRNMTDDELRFTWNNASQVRNELRRNTKAFKKIDENRTKMIHEQQRRKNLVKGR